MKKLICALVLLAMLVPVAAMAAEVTFESKLNLDALDSYQGNGYSLSTPIDGDPSALNGSRYQIKYNKDGVGYTAWYYPSGVLEKMMVSYSGPDCCGCMIMYAADGTMQEGPTMIRPDCTLDHKPPFTVHTNKSNVPAGNVTDIASGYSDFGALISDMANKLQNADVSSSQDGKQAIIAAGDGFYVSAVNGKALYVHYGPVVYNGSELAVYGDSSKNLHAWAKYDVGSGDLDHYGIFSDDGSIETVYDAKNRLVSTEIWTKDGAYWCFENDAWTFSADGDPRNVKPGTPTEEVLTKITLSPRAAEFSVASANSVADVADEDRGTPVVIGNVDAQTKAEMLDSHTSKFEMIDLSNQGFSEPISLLLPYGAGQNQAIAENFTYTIVHEPHDGAAETYSTEPTDASQITAQFTDKGILISGVESFSPFTVTWGDKQASTVGTEGVGSLPSTGDESNLLAYVCLLTACAAAFVVINKRRAHQ